MNVKKLISMVLALVMLLAMSAMAFAEDGESPTPAPSTTPAPTTYTISAESGTNHTYEIYQIFTGDLAGRVLSNLKWGQNGTGEEGEKVADSILTALEALNAKNEDGSDKTDAQKLAVILQYANLTSTPFGTAGAVYKENEQGELEKTGEKNQTGVPAGYYLIKDVYGLVDGTHDAYTTYIVKIVGDIEIDPKSSTPSVEKKVKDINDSVSGSKTDWQDSADHDVGDTMEFKLTGTLPSNYSEYKQYKMVFHDTMTNMESATITSVYLANDKGAKVEGGTFDDEDYALETTDGGFTVTFANLKNSTIKDKIKDNYKIVIEYTAVLSASAVMGSTGNPNEVYLEYSNNPYYTGNDDNTGETLKDKVIVFTYKVEVDKIDENEDPLSGAEFTLSKMENGSWVVIDKLTVTGGTNFMWEGLDDGDYMLEETETPDGYNTIDLIYFTIEAEHSEEAVEPVLISLSANQVDKNGDEVTGEIEFDVDKGEGALSTSVVNQKGATLPETGAQGTKMLYIAGGILVAAAVILLITKRRMNSAE